MVVVAAIAAHLAGDTSVNDPNEPDPVLVDRAAGAGRHGSAVLATHSTTGRRRHHRGRRGGCTVHRGRRGGIPGFGGRRLLDRRPHLGSPPNASDERDRRDRHRVVHRRLDRRPVTARRVRIDRCAVDHGVRVGRQPATAARARRGSGRARRTSGTRAGPVGRAARRGRTHTHRTRSARRGGPLRECDGHPGRRRAPQPHRLARTRCGCARCDRVDRSSDDDRTPIDSRRVAHRHRPERRSARHRNRRCCNSTTSPASTTSRSS